MRVFQPDVRAHVGASMLFFLSQIYGAPVFAQAGAQLAFPSAEGYGRFATGGRGGTVYKVTNLNSSGSGSLRNCIAASGARTCIFDISGVIDLGGSPITTGGGNLTIAGQTAPGDGIVIKGGGLKIHDGNVIVRHLRVRPGDLGSSSVNSTNDALQIFGADNIIVDHSSFSWGTDEVAGITYGSDDVTVQWNIFAQGLCRSVSGHPDGGCHSRGMLVGASSTSHIQPERISIVYNVIASQETRGPILYNQGPIDVINNVSYNTRNKPLNFLSINGDLFANLVGNYFKKGPDSDLGIGGIPINSASGARGAYYSQGNCDTEYRPTGAEPENINAENSSNFPIASTRYTAGRPTYPNEMNCLTALSTVLSEAGATVPTRTSPDTNILDGVINGTGRIIDDPSEVGGWESITVVTRGAGYDTDGDGIPNAWEQANGLNPADASDGAQLSANGYTNLENFLNVLAGDSVSGFAGIDDSQVPSPPDNVTIVSSP